MKQQFCVTGMTCSACSAHVEKAVGKVDGVNDLTVSLLTNSMSVTYDESKTSPQDIIAAVTAAGYGASVAGEKKSGKRSEPKEDVLAKELQSMKHRLIWSFVFLIPLFYISMGHMLGAPLPAFLTGMENALSFALTQLLLTLPILLHQESRKRHQGRRYQSAKPHPGHYRQHQLLPVSGKLPPTIRDWLVGIVTLHV